MRNHAAATLLASLLTAGSCATVLMSDAACAHAQAVSAFEVVPRQSEIREPHRAAYLTAFLGAACIAASFPLGDEADRRYHRYLFETDRTRIDERFRATTRMDRLSSASLLTGEGLLATAVYLRFVRHPAHARVSLQVEPTACAVSLRF
jgi:hypothetical protein